jgi:rod shape-determining protein MreD
MKPLNTILILIAAILAVFLQATWEGPRRALGAQIDLLPGLMVYVSLRGGLVTLTLLAVVGGFCFDALSANPEGVSVLPLFLIGFLIERSGHLLLRNQMYAQFVLGLGASAAMPLLTLVLLATLGYSPMIGLGSLWQLVVLSISGAALTPLYFKLFAWAGQGLSYRPYHSDSFRPDREVERGRRVKSGI